MNTTTNGAAIAEKIANDTNDTSICGIVDPIAGGAAEGSALRRRKAAVEATRQKTAPVPAGNKTAIVLMKLKTRRGATVESLMQATGWQAHSVRGFLSGTVRKKLALTVISEIGKEACVDIALTSTPEEGAVPVITKLDRELEQLEVMSRGELVEWWQAT